MCVCVCVGATRYSVTYTLDFAKGAQSVSVYLYLRTDCVYVCVLFEK